MKAITEEMGIQKDWYKEAREMTVDKLPEFVRKLREDFNHDYGTICHAIAAAGIAAMWAVERGPQGGITGFQAGAIQWELIRHWGAMGAEEGEPMWLVKASDYLYPQYNDKTSKISERTRDWLKAKAEENLKSHSTNAHPNVVAHWKTLASDAFPFEVRAD